MLNALHAKKPARNRVTVHQPSANGRPIKLAANAPTCAGMVPQASGRKVNGWGRHAADRNNSHRSVISSLATALPKAVRHNPRCVVMVSVRPVGHHAKVIAPCSHVAHAMETLPRKVVHAMVNVPKSDPVMGSAHPWKAAKVSARRTDLGMAFARRVPRVKAKALPHGRRCVMAVSDHKVENVNSRGSNRHVAQKAVAPPVNVVKAKTARSVRPQNANDLC